MYIRLFLYMGGGGGFPKFPVPGTVFWQGPRKNYNDSCLSASTFGGARSAPFPHSGKLPFASILIQYELQPIFPTQFKGYGFLIRDSIKDYTKLQEVHC